ncbi:MAG: hypothetical protein HC865_18790 [Cyanobacteria bacterium RU_5_0]|nr:hypothetical protein [Cyanobacteria bacterium RU_5_0]
MDLLNLVVLALQLDRVSLERIEARSALKTAVPPQVGQGRDREYREWGQACLTDQEGARGLKAAQEWRTFADYKTRLPQRYLR